jgi:long-chain acyl-CoA synthetase
MAAGHVLVPLYTTLIPDQVAYIIADAGARLVFVSTMAHLETILALRDRLPTVEKVVVFYPENLEEDDFVVSLDTFKAVGEGRSRADFDGLWRQVRVDDPATFVYTSGTTGRPKGVVLSHANFAAEFATVESIFQSRPGDTIISFLPLSHILQRVTDAYALLHGVTIAYGESLETLGEDLREVRPTLLVAVPRVYEKVFARVHEGIDRSSALARALFNWAVNVGRRTRAAEAAGKVPRGLARRHAVATALVFGKIHQATGGRVRFYVSTAAPLAKVLAEFFDAVGIRILEVWGMTELTGAATLNTPDAFRFGSVGKPGVGVELKVTDDGEICVRGGIVMQEYWGQSEATAETIDGDGWLHTGDVGHVDDDGYLTITDRLKELIVTAGGKNVAPQPLENALKGDRLIAQAMVLGDRRHFISALIVPEREALLAWAAEEGLEGNLIELCRHPTVVEHYRVIVDGIMEHFSRYERVRRFELVPEEFTQESGALTPTLKLKRRVLLERYADLIDGMYEG